MEKRWAVADGGALSQCSKTYGRHFGHGCAQRTRLAVMTTARRPMTRFRIANASRFLMFENRSLKLDLFALALLAACVFLGTALATYDPADQPGTLVYPPRAEYQNACGPIGAYAAHALYAGVGFGAYYLLGSLITVGVLLLKRREIDQPALRGVGWAISLAAFSTLIAMLLPQSSPGPEVGAGGYLGAMGYALLESKFALAGAFILALSVLLAGLLVAATRGAEVRATTSMLVPPTTTTHCLTRRS